MFDRGGVSLETEKGKRGTTSKLLITRALLDDSGNYTCASSKVTPASVMVHVLNGEQNGIDGSGGEDQVVVNFKILFVERARKRGRERNVTKLFSQRALYDKRIFVLIPTRARTERYVSRDQISRPACFVTLMRLT